MAKKPRRNPRGVSIDRFIWREGDLQIQIIYDPREDRTRNADANLDDARQVDLEGGNRRKDP